MKTLNEIKAQVYGMKPPKITQEVFEDLKQAFTEKDAETGEIRDLKMTRRRADYLFDLKYKAKNNVCSDFENWFCDKITTYVIYENDNLDISPEERIWLRKKMRYNDRCDDSLRETLTEELDKFGKDLHPSLKKKGILVKKFEDILYNSSYIAIIAVVGAIISSFILFIQGFALIIRGLVTFFQDPEEKYEVLFERLVSSVDVFLFGLVLIIFGVGVYELFIANIDPDEESSSSRPVWMKIKSVDDLKSQLGKVILMVLIVSFFKHVLEISSVNWSPLALLYLAIGILMIGATLYLTHKSQKIHEEH